METLKEHLVGKLEFAKKAYLGDLNAMDEGQLTSTSGGSSRTPADFTYEIVVINNRISKRMRGEDPGEFKFDGWVKAPEDFQSKDTIVAELDKSVTEIIDAFAKVPDDEMFRKIETPSGETCPMDLAGFAATHMTYHDAQLNYIQAMKGDEEMHWN